MSMDEDEPETFVKGIWARVVSRDETPDMRANADAVDETLLKASDAWVATGHAEGTVEHIAFARANIWWLAWNAWYAWEACDWYIQKGEEFFQRAQEAIAYHANVSELLRLRRHFVARRDHRTCWQCRTCPLLVALQKADDDECGTGRCRIATTWAEVTDCIEEAGDCSPTIEDCRTS